MTLSQIPPEQRGKELAAWRTMRGVTHLCVHTVGLGLHSPGDHVKALEQFKIDVLD